MKPGDLVVRIWIDKPKWDMIGLIVSKDFVCKTNGGAEWIYGIKWNKRDFAPIGEPNPFGKWKEGEFEVINESR